MAKICFPHHTRGEFGSLNEAFRYLRKREYGWSWFTLTEIVKCNVYYRDYLREYGIDSLIKIIIEEVPELTSEKVSFVYLRKWAAKEKLSEYDIQCYNINDKFTILGHTFNGLEDVIMHRKIFSRKQIGSFDCYSVSDKDSYSDICIGELYDSYPIFDSYDSADNRTYQNYIFRKKLITVQDMMMVSEITDYSNYCLVHEHIPSDLLPILYYKGDGNYMLLATNKINR